MYTPEFMRLLFQNHSYRAFLVVRLCLIQNGLSVFPSIRDSPYYAWHVLQVVVHFIDEQSSRHQFHHYATGASTMGRLQLLCKQSLSIHSHSLRYPHTVLAECGHGAEGLWDFQRACSRICGLDTSTLRECPFSHFEGFMTPVDR